MQTYVRQKWLREPELTGESFLHSLEDPNPFAEMAYQSALKLAAPWEKPYIV